MPVIRDHPDYASGACARRGRHPLFDFETVWDARRDFLIDGVPVPTARLLHIVESKQATGRDKDKLFLATHLDALQQLLKKPDAL